MGQTLTHGVYLPDEGERNCYNGLAANWSILDGAVGTIAEHTTQIAGKAPAVHTHTKSDITDFPAYGTTAGTICEGNDSRLSDARTPVAHTHGKADITDLFNSANTWSGNQYYTGMMILNSSSDIAEQFRQELPKDVSTSSDALVRFNTLTDSEGHNVVVEASGHWENYVSKSITLKYKNDSTKQGTIDFRLESNGHGVFYPQSPFECILGNSGNQWKSIYAQNYFYNGTAWGLDKVNTWSALNCYRKGIWLDGSRDAYIFPENAASYSGLTFATQTYSQSFKFGDFTTSNDEISFNYNNAYLSINVGYSSSDSKNKIDITPRNADESSLGTSTYKWKYLNGINPGALSLPDYTLAKVDLIDFSQWSVAGQPNEYIPISDGWLFVNIKDTASNSIFIYAHGLYNSDPTKATDYSASCFGNGSQGVNGRIAVMIPVRAGIAYRVFIRAASVSEIWSARFYPALGNV